MLFAHRWNACLAATEANRNPSAGWGRLPRAAGRDLAPAVCSATNSTDVNDLNRVKLPPEMEESRAGREGPTAPVSPHKGTSSGLTRQAPQNTPSSADHIITIESFNRQGGWQSYRSSVPSSPGPQATIVPALDVVPAAAAVLSAAGGDHSTRSTPPGVSPRNPASASDGESFDMSDLEERPLLQSQYQEPATASYQPAGPFAYITASTSARPVSPQSSSAIAAAAANGLTPPGTAVVSPGLTAEQAAALQSYQKKLGFAYGLSWVVNILLLVAKLYAYYISQSKAVLASAADSAVDLVSQVVIAYADWKVKQQDPMFPVGQARLEAIGVLACACIMSVASFEVISQSIGVVVTALQTGVHPVLELGLVMYIVLGSATVLKLVCYLVCGALASKSDSMVALAEDHLNDIMSNVCAIITAVAAGLVPNGWWIDPVGAVAISLYIVARWLAIAKQQVDKIVGKGAPAQFVEQLEELANTHHEAMRLDVIRAYHFGARYIVEMEVVMPALMTVQNSHDISLELQHKVEQLEEVERAFVHVDYMRRDGLEHKVERELAGRSSSGSGNIRNQKSPSQSDEEAAVELRGVPSSSSV